jgi:hypothetical protein
VRRLLILLLAGLVTSLLFVAPANAVKTGSEFPPGIWRGKAVWTGTITNGTVTVYVAGAGIIDFEMTVAPDGTVTDGDYILHSTNINEDIAGVGPVTASVAAMGNMTGTGAMVTGNGNFNIKIISWPLPIAPMEFGESGGSLGFYPATASCTFVQGDMAELARDVQQAAGFSTSIKAPFTATRISAPGEKGSQSWDDNYVELVTAMETLASQPKPAIQDVKDLANKVDLFNVNLVKSSTCSDTPKNLQKGKQPYNYFLEKFSQLMTKILSDPSGYTGADISDLLMIAVHIGAVGSAAPDDAAAQQLEASFKQVLGQKLQADIAANDTTDITIIYIAAAQAGFTELAAQAKAAL